MLAIPEITEAELGALCQRFHVRELAVFGSLARGEARQDSDADVCIEFEDGYHPGLGWFELEEELERIFGRKVDLSRKLLLKARVRDTALRDALVLYEA
jgi:uncharacterized protein